MKTFKRQAQVKAHEQLVLYMKDYRISQNMTVAQVADVMGVSKAVIERLERITDDAPRPIKSLKVLYELASLKGISTESFVSILLGKLNENAEKDSYSSELTEDISKCNDHSKAVLKRSLQNPRRFDRISHIVDKLTSSRASQNRVDLHDRINDLNEDQIDAVLRLLNTFEVKKRKK